jgi:hypothetical protein
MMLSEKEYTYPLKLIGKKSWTLLDSNRKPCQSAIPGALGGHRRQRTYEAWKAKL